MRTPMAAAIILGEEASLAELNSTREMMQRIGFDSLITIAPLAMIRQMPDSVATIALDGGVLSQLMRTALDRLASETVMIVQARCELSGEGLVDAYAEAQDGGMVFVTLSAGSDTIEMPEIEAGNIVNMLARKVEFPLAAVAAEAETLRSQMPEHSEFASEILLRTAIRAHAHGDRVAASQAVAGMSANATNRKRLSVSEMSLSQTLATVIDNYMIEDIFPQHAWADHDKESLAACYHTLAAMFIRWGDTESALGCLQNSDALEDSPRSLALKGLIASIQGETLGAVAHFVSSLQQYELRKNPSNEHYLKFAPENFDKIHERLADGLEALNSKDNKRALANFAQAIFDFDPLFRDAGLDMKRYSQ